jgi:hypothetical protein
MSRLTVDLNFTSGHERTLLAAAMNGGNGDLIVTADDFFSPPHRQIFNVIASLPCSQRKGAAAGEFSSEHVTPKRRVAR